MLCRFHPYWTAELVAPEPLVLQLLQPLPLLPVLHVALWLLHELLGARRDARSRSGGDHSRADRLLRVPVPPVPQPAYRDIHLVPVVHWSSFFRPDLLVLGGPGQRHQLLWLLHEVRCLWIAVLLAGSLLRNVQRLDLGVPLWLRRRIRVQLSGEPSAAPKRWIHILSQGGLLCLCAGVSS